MSRRKPPSDRERRGTNDAGEIEPYKGKVPAIRENVSTEVEADWRAFWGSTLANLVQEPDMPAIRRLFKLYDLADQATADWQIEPYVSGSGGQLMLHPAVKLLMAVLAEIRQLEDRFGITPKARMTLGIEVGKARKTLEDLDKEFEGEQ